jgi:hypothetical protein
MSEIDPGYWAEVDAIVDELEPLIRTHPVHVSALHEVDDVRNGKDPGLKSCPGCRAILLTKRLYEITEARDDDVPQPRLGGKSRRTAKVEEVQARRERETPRPAVPPDRGRP